MACVAGSHQSKDPEAFTLWKDDWAEDEWCSSDKQPLLEGEASNGRSFSSAQENRYWHLKQLRYRSMPQQALLNTSFGLP